MVAGSRWIAVLAALGAFATVAIGSIGVTACKGGGDAPVVQPGAVAGHVLEVHDTVTATRAGATRTLAIGGEISADDVIDTGAAGSIVIELAHNGVRWELGMNKHVRVADSAAWNAPRDDHAIAVNGDPVTGAAGRNAERSAAEGAPSGRPADDGVGAAAPAAPAAPAMSPPPSPGAVAMPSPSPSPSPAISGKSDGNAPVRPARTAAASAHKPGLGADDSEREIGGAAPPSPSPPPPPAAEGPPPVLQPTAALRDTNAAPTAPAVSLLGSHRAALVACLPTSAPHAHLTVTVHAGHMTVSWDAITDATIQKCIVKTLSTIAWPAGDTTAEIAL